MLDNIKLILGIEDNKQDDLILLYLAKVETIVVEYCTVGELNSVLESFIEDKVVSIIKAKNNGEVKSVTRGDTKIEYNVADLTSSGANLSENDRKFLNKFRKVRCY